MPIKSKLKQGNNQLLWIKQTNTILTKSNEIATMEASVQTPQYIPNWKQINDMKYNMLTHEKMQYTTRE